MKKLKVTVISAEILGLALLASEFGILTTRGIEGAHVLGYLGATFLVIGSFLWNKLK